MAGPRDWRRRMAHQRRTGELPDQCPTFIFEVIENGVQAFGGHWTGEFSLPLHLGKISCRAVGDCQETIWI